MMNREKRTSHLLLEQDIHSVRDELLITRKDMVCLGMGNTPFEVVYVELHYLVGVQSGSNQIHLLWQVLLSEFDIVHVTQKAIKGSTLADYLAQQPINDYQPMHPEFPDENIMALFEEEGDDEDKEKWIV